MEVLIFQKEAFEEMAAKFSRFSDRVNELRHAGLFAYKPQSVLPIGGCVAHRQAR